VIALCDRETRLEGWGRPVLQDGPRKSAASSGRGRNEGADIGNKGQRCYTVVLRRRSALPTTLTDDSAMAAAAITGDSRMPNTG
jgi:hypothetical protein